MHTSAEPRLSSTELASAAATALQEFQQVPVPTTERLELRLGKQRAVAVPRVAFELFMRILAEMANGNAVTIVPIHAELTTQQAAALLNVSRPFVIKLLDEGKIPFSKVGNRRKVKFADLLAYKTQDDAQREKIFDELAAEAQKLGFEY